MSLKPDGLEKAQNSNGSRLNIHAATSEHQTNVTSSQELFTPEHVKLILDDVISGEFGVFNCESMADYSADFQHGEPIFLNIWTHISGYGFGYIVFHDFLRRVGKNNTFLSTDLTDAGMILFKKAQDHGLIQKIEIAPNIGRYSRWKVIGDINQNLIRMKDQLG